MYIDVLYTDNEAIVYARRRNETDQMKKINLFLSSTFDQSMIVQRDLFRNELRFRLNEELGQYGIYFYLYDFELGIPKHTKPQHVIRTCLRAIAAGNMFLGIIGNSYGTPIQSFVKKPEELKQLKTDFPMLAKAIDENASVLELEFLYAMQCKKVSKMFLVLKNRKRDPGNKVKRLIFKIRQSGQKCVEAEDDKNIKDKVTAWVLNMAHVVCKGQNPSGLTAYAIRKTRYYVEDPQMADVYKYLKGSSKKVLCIYDDKGSGKTVMMARLYLEQAMQGMCFAFAGCEAFTLSEIIRVLLKQIYIYYGMPAKKLDTVYSEKEFVQLFQETIKEVAVYPLKCCLILDGMDKIQMLDLFSVQAILPDRLPENIKMIVTTNDREMISHKKVSFLLHKPIDPYKMVEKMLWAEGKQEERRRIEKNGIFRKRAELSLDYVYVFILELAAAAKYDTVKKMLYKQAVQAADLADLYHVFLKRMLHRFPYQTQYIKRLMFYLVCTEHGLTEIELELLNGESDSDILSFVYPYLEITGERRMKIQSESFRNAVCMMWGAKEEQLRIFRKNIVDVCFDAAKEDPVLGREILHQLLHIRDAKRTEHVLLNMQVVDSMTYENEAYAFEHMQKLSGFEKCKNIWFQTEVTQSNYIYMLTVVHMELEQGQPDDAHRHLERMLALRKQGKIASGDAGNIYNSLSVLYAKKLQYRKAQKYAKEALQAVQNSGDPVRICEYKNQLCRVYFNMGYYEAAYVYGNRLLKFYGNPFYDDTVYSLRVRATMLHILNKQGRHKEFQKKYRKLMPAMETVFGKQHAEAMDIRMLNVHHLIAIGELERALPECRKAKNDMQNSSKFLKEALFAQCDIYHTMGNRKKEAASLAEIEKLLKTEDHKDLLTVITWYEKKMFYDIETGRPKEAVKIGKRVREMLAQSHASEPWKADGFWNMGAAYEAMGDNRLSMECYEKARCMIHRQNGVYKEKEAGIYNQIGSCAHNMQLYKKAYDAYKKALQLLEQDSCCRVKLYGTVLNNLGQLMQEIKQDANALYFYRKGLRFYQKYFPKERAGIANILDNTGSVFDLREEYEKAAYFHGKGLWRRLKSGGLYTPSTVTSLHNLANTWNLAGKWLPALLVERMAVRGLKKQEVCADDYPVYLCMGELLERMHLRNFALTYFKRASYLLRRKKEIVSETVEIHLILATFAKDWEKNENSEKRLLRALELLEHKQEWHRKDDELKMALYLSLEHYYYCLERYEDALNCLDIVEETLDSCLCGEEYADIREMVSYERERYCSK